MENHPRHCSFFQNRQCEYFPCHAGIDEADFNCLFCFCPLFALGKSCGGNCQYTGRGDKDCSRCTFPHRRENYERVLARYADILAAAARTDAEAGQSPGAPEKKVFPPAAPAAED